MRTQYHQVFASPSPSGVTVVLHNVVGSDDVVVVVLVVVVVVVAVVVVVVVVVENQGQCWFGGSKGLRQLHAGCR